MRGAGPTTGAVVEITFALHLRVTAVSSLSDELTRAAVVSATPTDDATPCPDERPWTRLTARGTTKVTAD